ncbi:MAG TPA: hypothetical protein VLH12_08660 [Usitatibacter sp.]|nr:hypothetical protein [Usitatibacter sp.]
MTRALSTATAAAVAKTVTEPGHLLQIGLSFLVRYSSRGDVHWNGVDWIAANLRVGQLQEKADGSVALTVTVGNTDLAFGALCLAEPPQEKDVAVWAFYEGATGATDPVQIFGGVIQECAISEAAVTLMLASDNQNTLAIPRRRITRDTGFTRLLPSGRVIEFGGVRYQFTRG